MKKQHILAVLFLSGVWGLSEALLGGWMYSAGMRMAPAVILTVVAMGVMAIAKVYVPSVGSAIVVAGLAMLYKFLNQPFFACHLFAILLLGISFEVVFAITRGRRKPLIGLAATYMGFALFAVMMVFVFRYSWWTNPGWSKALSYVGVTGSIAAMFSAVAVPLGDRFARRLQQDSTLKLPMPNWAVLSATSAVVWAFAIVHGLLVL
jgi:ABC-type thiamin/hydroxymethylpyrimidine transport system permease subunit